MSYLPLLYCYFPKDEEEGMEGVEELYSMGKMGYMGNCAMLLFKVMDSW